MGVWVETVLHLGGDFGTFKLMLWPAGARAKKSQKIRDVSVTPV